MKNLYEKYTYSDVILAVWHLKLFMLQRVQYYNKVTINRRFSNAESFSMKSRH